MSMIYPHWDSEYTLLDVTKDSFTFRKYYEDSKCTHRSTKLLGRYQKTIVAIIKKDLPRGERMFLPSNLNNKCTEFELEGIWSNCEYYLENGFVDFVSEKVDENPDYDPEFWQQEYEAQAEAVAMAEKEGYHIF